MMDQLRELLEEDEGCVKIVYLDHLQNRLPESGI